MCMFTHVFLYRLKRILGFVNNLFVCSKVLYLENSLMEAFFFFFFGEALKLFR